MCVSKSEEHFPVQQNSKLFLGFLSLHSNFRVHFQNFYLILHNDLKQFNFCVIQALLSFHYILI